MASSFSVDTSGASEKIKAIRTKLSDGIGKVLEQELTNARAEIIARTESGRDVSGNQFKRYTDKYELAKRRKLGGPSIPNLTATGTMLRSIKVKVTRAAGGFLGKIYVSGAQADKVRGNQKLRKFFDLSKEQLENIKRKINEALNGRR